MLTELHVKNLALIEEAEVLFGEGLNILTGETGAGKSILLGALGLALGGKASLDFLRSGENEALVEAVFEADEPSQKKLSELDIECEDGELILSRKISSDGKSVAKLNGERVNLSRLKEAAEVLLDIHGQHDHQSLLKSSKHLDILDSYIGNEITLLKSDLKEKVSELHAIEKELSAGDIDESSRLRNMGLLEHEINIIKDAHLKPGEDDELWDEFRKLSNSEKIKEALMEADRELSGDAGASSAIDRALRRLDAVSEYDDTIRSAYSALSDASDIVGDAARSISDYLRSSDDDSQRLAEVQSRFELINDLKARFGRTIEDVLKALSDKEAELSKLTNLGEYVAELRMKQNAVYDDAQKLCTKISEIRREKAAVLCDNIRQNLLDLSFLDVKFSMEFERCEISADGFDKAAFMISVNPGEPIKRLDEIASGGEISRIMLAIKTVLAAEDEIGTLVFDEIDSGIGGHTANAVAEKLALIAKSHQVICITHLHQIAAMADAHFLIEKSVQSDSTVSGIRPLDKEESVMELCRMLGGEGKDSPAYLTAKDLLIKADKRKENL